MKKVAYIFGSRGITVYLCAFAFANEKFPIEIARTLGTPIVQLFSPNANF
jgi:hypothetical protein